MNQIGQIIAQRLESIEKVARQTLRDVEAIRGVCVGYAAAKASLITPTANLRRSAKRPPRF